MNVHILKFHRILISHIRLKPCSKALNQNHYQTLCSRSYFSLGKSSISCLPVYSGLARHESLALISTSFVAFKIWNKDKDQGQTEGSANSKDDSLNIILIDTKGNVSASTLKRAGMFAKRNDLKLVQIEEPLVRTTGKGTYKLMTGKEYYELQRQKKMGSKTPSSKVNSKHGQKHLKLSSTISSNDFSNKMVTVSKWLEKGFQIKVNIISKGTQEDMKNTFIAIENEVNKHQGRIMQRDENVKDKFYISPPEEKLQEHNPEKKEQDPM